MICSVALNGGLATAEGKNARGPEIPSPAGDSDKKVRESEGPERLIP